MSSRISCGRDYHCTSDICSTLDECSRHGFDFACVPLVNPRYKREFIGGPAATRPGALTRSDMLLTSQDWSSLIVSKVSPWLQLDSKNETTRRNSEQALKQELSYASHLGVPAIVIPVRNKQSANLARVVNTHVLGGHAHQFWIKIPIKATEDEIDCIQSEEGGGGDSAAINPVKTDSEEEWTQDTWHWWNNFKTMCDSHKRIGLSLELSEDLPSSEIMERWYGEPIKSCYISTSLFLTNKKGFPVLSRAHQHVIFRLFKLDVQLVVTGTSRHDKGIRSYQQYLEHVWNMRPPADNVEKFAKGYEDYLQCPLQPLMDNLESSTYEVFEKDPVKYSQYQKAVYQALLDRVPDEHKDTSTQVVMVVGAGRGPLVTASITAAAKADRKIKVYAVEKNSNAVVTLMNMKEDMWGDQVTVVSCDMRVFNPPEKADILVSELLGSFGDNELSPECLDGAQKFLKDDGISIPQAYTSYLAPIVSSKLWNEIRNCKEMGKTPEAPFETPYVVRLHNAHLLDAPQPLFTFCHPNKDGAIDNQRYDSLSFKTQTDATMHGFSGYFDCVLYADVNLSIVPETHSPGMFSWFPIYLPIKEPFLVKKGDTITVHMWRVVSDKNVWYEWCITEPRACPIHNPKGRSYTIGL